MLSAAKYEGSRQLQIDNCNQQIAELSPQRLSRRAIAPRIHSLIESTNRIMLSVLTEIRPRRGWLRSLIT